MDATVKIVASLIVGVIIALVGMFFAYLIGNEDWFNTGIVFGITMAIILLIFGDWIGNQNKAILKDSFFSSIDVLFIIFVMGLYGSRDVLIATIEAILFYIIAGCLTYLYRKHIRKNNPDLTPIKKSE